ncbi:MAG TPA: four helix bundle protein [Phycisphaerales bacterium]|nr:four helix bundle protein [Phycisphaerales bacterium]
MTEIRSFRDLVAWQKAFHLGIQLHRIARTFPSEERFALSMQLRRCAISIASNIAEGYGRESLPDYVRFLRIARGSLYEAETQLLFANELKFVSIEQLNIVQQQLDETSRVLGGLIRSLEHT